MYFFLQNFSQLLPSFTYLWAPWNRMSCICYGELKTLIILFEALLAHCLYFRDLFPLSEHFEGLILPKLDSMAKNKSVVNFFTQGRTWRKCLNLTNILSNNKITMSIMFTRFYCYCFLFIFTHWIQIFNFKFIDNTKLAQIILVLNVS